MAPLDLGSAKKELCETLGGTWDEEKGICLGASTSEIDERQKCAEARNYWDEERGICVPEDPNTPAPTPFEVYYPEDKSIEPTLSELPTTIATGMDGGLNDLLSRFLPDNASQETIKMVKIGLIVGIVLLLLLVVV